MEGFDIGKIMSMFGDFQKINGDFLKTLDEKEVSASVGGGMVKISITGTGKIKSLFIDEEIFKTGDKEMLEDLIKAAIQSLISQLKSSLQETFTSNLLNKFPINDIFGNIGDDGNE